MTEQELENYTLHRRFDRMGRLIGDAKMKKLMDSHIMIVGLGGVGSWAAESIVRSGVGRVSLVDFDEVCITNFNRQLHALQGVVGQKKSDVMADRLRKINPQADVRSIPLFYNAKFCDEILATRPDFIIDAIDSVTPKCHLLATCKEREIPVVSSTGSAAKMDPSLVKTSDLAHTEIDPLARSVRKILRDQYGFPQTGAFGIQAVYSTEPWSEPVELKYDGGKGFRCVCPQKDNEFFQCDNRNIILGNTSFVTGTFGLFCASIAVRALIGEKSASSKQS
jgi:tRNA A37 threonylcarbamoyladenosine dehydratase